jgi:hypothetical protein
MGNKRTHYPAGTKLIVLPGHWGYAELSGRIQPVSTPAECCAACWGRAECNAWVFCADVNGCGFCTQEELVWDPSDPLHNARCGHSQTSTCKKLDTCTLRVILSPSSACNRKGESHPEKDSTVQGHVLS